MSPRPLLLLALVLAVAAVAWMFSGIVEAAPPQPPGAPAAPADGEKAPAAGSASGAGAEAATDTSLQRADVAPAGGPSRPFAPDARWVALTVVDPSGQPAPHAEVHWHEEFTWRERNDRQSHDERFDLEQRDPVAAARTAGWTVQADSEGRARVTVGKTTSIAAVLPGLYGTLKLHDATPEPPGGHRVRLAADASLPVRVVDERGQPQSEVPITLASIDSDGDLVGPFGWTLLALTDDEGMATIPHFQEWARLLESDPAARGWQHTVRAYLPGSKDRGVPVDPWQPPPSLVELQLPPCGELLVRATMHGQPVPFRGAVLVAHDSPLGGHRRAGPASDGWARIRHVPTGVVQRAHVDAFERVWQDVTLPPGMREPLRLEIGPGADAMVCRGRIVDASGQPLVDTMLYVSAQGESFSGGASGRTDGAGSFVVPVGTVSADATPGDVAIEFIVWREREQVLRAKVPSRRAGPGVHQLGDIVVTAGALVAKGTVHAGGEPYLGEAGFDIEQWTPDGWSSFYEVYSFVDQKGGFELRGDAPPGRYRLTCSSEDCLPSAPVEFQHGQQDVVVAMTRGGQLAAGVLVPPGTDSDHVTLRLVPEGRPAEEDEQWRLRAATDLTDRERWLARWLALRAGRYTLEAGFFGQPPAVRVEGLEVPGPAGGDPRLAEIDLRGVTRRVLVHVRDEEGQLLEDCYGAIFIGERAPGGDWQGLPFYGGTARIRVPTGATPELLVTAHGRRPATVVARGDAVDVRLLAWPTVVLQFANGADLPAGATLHVALEPQRQEERMWRDPWSPEPLGELLQPGTFEVEVTNGRVELPIGDGLHRLRVSISGEQGGHPIEHFEPREILPNAGEVTVRIAPEAWQRAKAAVTK